MSSIRDLKMDVKYLIGHFIDECYTQLAFSVIPNQENTLDIISDALALRDATITKISFKPKNKESKTDRAYYNGIAEEFYKQIIELSERLHSLEN